MGDPWIVSGAAAAVAVNVILTAYVILAWNDPEPAGTSYPARLSQATALPRDADAPVVQPASLKGGKAQ